MEKTNYDDVTQHVSKDIQPSDHKDVLKHNSDREALTEKAVIESYRAMYQKWLQTVR